MHHRHRQHRFLLVGLFLAAAASSAPARADYPIASHRYLADPGSLVLNGRVYLYNSNDDDNDGGYQMHSIVCTSTSDMKNWTDHGIVFQVPAGASWARNSWAPQPIARDGTIYLYFGNSGSGVGVATSTNPTSGFKDPRGSYLIDGSTPGASGTNNWLFDPGALIDTDGSAYLAFGGNGETNARIIKLGSDLTSVSGSAVKLAPTGFFEAAFLFKRNDIYYLAYSSDTAHGLRIDYLSSSSPMSGYTYRGVLAGQPPSNNNNNHASEFEFMGQWYHAYHNRLVAKTAGIDATYKRNLALEVLDFKADGTIQEVTYTTDGVPQVGSLNPYVRVEAETTKAQSGIETEACSKGGMDVTSITDGDWVSVRGVDFGAGAKTFSASVASASTAGAIEIRSGSPTGTVLGTCDVPVTGGAQTWQTTTCSVTGATGVIKDLYFKFKGGGFSFDYWQFTGSGDMGGTGGASGTGGSPSSAGASASSGSGVAGSASGGTGSGVGGTSASGGGGAANAVGGSPAAGGRAEPSGGAGAVPAGGAQPVPPPAQGRDDSSGCACTLGSRSSSATPLMSFGLVLAGLLRLRAGRRKGAKTTEAVRAT
ncbi:MAG TPA: glycoside hydrolase family 43 protein [Polyangiaceae bacterium]|nr:glycoside hydrolase family 43 protein [Polyangiaceae bacterium]